MVDRERGEQWFSTRADSATPRDMWQCLKIFSAVKTWGLLLASTRQKPGTLLCTL